MTETATSETTSRLRKRLLDRLRCAGRNCDALRAGANPKTRLVRIAAATANSTAGALIRTVCQRSSWGEPKRMNNSSTQPPIAIPAAPEIAASSRLSVSSCRTIRARLIEGHPGLQPRHHIGVLMAARIGVQLGRSERQRHVELRLLHELQHRLHHPNHGELLRDRKSVV